MPRPVTRALKIVDKHIEENDKRNESLMELRALLADMDASTGKPDTKRKKRKGKKNKKGK
jgi:hypothetical protein